MTVYIPIARFEALAAAIAALEPCPLLHRITADQIKLVLGEAGGIWPDYCANEDHDAVSAERQFAVAETAKVLSK